MDIERVTHEGRMIEVVEKDVIENGKQKTFEYARRSPGIRLIISKGDRIYLTKELRHELNDYKYASGGTYDYRLPGGKVFDSLSEYKAAIESGADTGRAAKQAAIKEAKEEAGIEAKNIRLLHKSICGSSVIWDLFYFLVEDFDDIGQQIEDEDITVTPVSRDEAKAMTLDGRMSEERSALVLLRYLEGKLS